MNLPENQVGVAFEARLADVEPAVAYRDSALVSDLIGRALRSSGLGQSDPDRPLADVIQPGMSVLLKPNWVSHRNRSGRGMECLVTHDRVILETLREVCNCRPGRVIIGDAPIQSADFASVVGAAFRGEAAAICESAKVPLEIVDFRRQVTKAEQLAGGIRDNARDKEHYVLFDLASDSLLEPLSDPQGRFRVTDYDPRALSVTHGPGRHQYLLCKEPFTADVFLSLPKLKTHSKAGLTAALKNLVGVNGNKDYLPHHRVGGSDGGGDCYPGHSIGRRFVEFCNDHANMNIGNLRYRLWRGLGRLQAKAIAPRPQFSYEGAWHGNDTVWRMVLDLNRLLLYGRADGTIADRPERRILSLTDAIVGGEGNGPLASLPKVFGAITCASSSAFADLAHASLMCYDWRMIPLVRESFGNFRFPLVEHAPTTCRVSIDGETMTCDEARQRLGRPFLPADGWIDHLSANHVVHDRHSP